MTAGPGGGTGAPSGTGTCIGPNCGVVGGGGGGAKSVAGTDRFWGRNVANALEAHIEDSKRVNVDSFVGEFEVWVSGSGVLTKARLTKSSGNAKLDQTVLALLETARGLKPPSASLPMPQRIKVGRKRF
jgi:TonB family protein